MPRKKETLKLDFKMTPNFVLREAVHWAEDTSMSFANKQKANELAEKAAVDFQTMTNIVRIAIELQTIRDKINKAFSSYGGNISIIVTSWLRPIEWEIYRRRNGTSQHVFGHAVDFKIAGVSNKDYNRIMEWLFKDIFNWNGGLAKSITKGHYNFIHIDLGRKRRWTY